MFSPTVHGIELLGLYCAANVPIAVTTPAAPEVAPVIVSPTLIVPVMFMPVVARSRNAFWLYRLNGPDCGDALSEVHEAS